MFEQFDEHARRSIFFARYEASVFGSPWIESEHLLLGIIREDWNLRNELPAGAREQIRKEVERRSPGPHPSVPTSLDLPLSRECARSLTYCAEEAETLQHDTITTGHLVLGLLRVEECMAADILLHFGIDFSRYRSVVQKHAFRATGRPSVSAEPTEEKVMVVAPSLESSVNALQHLVDSTAKALGRYLDPYSEQRLKRRPWTRREALGHLIDWAAAHQQWFARALTESKLVAAGYPEEDWISVQQYADFSWQDAADLWVLLNRLLVHVLARIPEDKLNTPCRIGIVEPIPLSALIAGYVALCEDIVGQILAHL